MLDLDWVCIMHVYKSCFLFFILKLTTNLGCYHAFNSHLYFYYHNAMFGDDYHDSFKMDGNMHW